MQTQMSSKEALDLDGSARKGRARKTGSVWESKMMVKTGTQFSATADITQQNTAKIRSRSSTEIQVDKQSPATAKNKTAVKRSDLGNIKKTPPQIKRTRSATTTTTVVDEINSVKLRKIKSDSAKVAAHDSTSEVPVDKQTTKNDDETVVAADLKEDIGILKSSYESDEAITTNNADQVLHLEEEEEKEIEVEVEKASLDIKDRVISLQEHEIKHVQITTNNADQVPHLDEEEEKEIEVEVEKATLDIKDRVISLQEQKPKQIAIEEKKLVLDSKDRSPPVAAPPIVEKIAPERIQPKLNPLSDDHHGISTRLQSFTDLIMWRDASRSAFVFGVGAFAIISSSYTKDLNISCISVLSYLGLVYLAVSFIFRSIISRGNVDIDSRDEEYVVGEEEAVWLIKLVLPYVNEFLSKLRSLFSGDPATTMKLAVLLFILARCGGSITIWKMTKLGFFGVFMVPKLCSSYSSHLAAYGTFWVRRFGDAWESCSHKKAVAFGIFSLVWNLSSVVARIWAVFLLFVAFRYYQQYRIRAEELSGEVVTQKSDFRYSGKRLQAQKSKHRSK